MFDNDPIREGDLWRWPDGTTLPVVEGGADEVLGMPLAERDPGDGGEAAPDIPDAPDAPEAPAAPDAPSDDDTFYEGWPEAAVKAHRELKDENVRYKDRFRPYEQAVGALHDDDQQFFLGFIDAVRSATAPNASPQAIERLSAYGGPVRSLLDKLTPAQQKAVEEAVDAATADDFDPFDPKQIEKLTEDRINAALSARDKQDEERRAKEAYDREVADINAQIQREAAKAADVHGVPEWADTTSGLYAALVSVAHRSFPRETPIEQRMAKAAEMLRGDFDRRGQELLKAKTAGAVQKPAPQGGEQPSGQKVPTSLDEAHIAAAKRLEGLARGPG